MRKEPVLADNLLLYNPKKAIFCTFDQETADQLEQKLNVVTIPQSLIKQTNLPESTRSPMLYAAGINPEHKKYFPEIASVSMIHELEKNFPHHINGFRNRALDIIIQSYSKLALPVFRERYIDPVITSLHNRRKENSQEASLQAIQHHGGDALLVEGLKEEEQSYLQAVMSLSYNHFFKKNVRELAFKLHDQQNKLKTNIDCIEDILNELGELITERPTITLDKFPVSEVQYFDISASRLELLEYIRLTSAEKVAQENIKEKANLVKEDRFHSLNLPYIIIN
ncbi:MAG: hypothetical protein ACMXYD_02320 [Candidatus Woesearchaeota archaeon]